MSKCKLCKYELNDAPVLITGYSVFGRGCIVATGKCECPNCGHLQNVVTKKIVTATHVLEEVGVV